MKRVEIKSNYNSPRSGAGRRSVRDVNNKISGLKLTKHFKKMVTTRSGKTYGESAGVMHRSRNRTYAKKRKAPAKQVSASLVKRVMLRAEEMKRFSAMGLSNAAASGNTYYGENLMYWINTGSTNSNRIGDKVHISKFIVAGMITKNLPSTGVSTSYGATFWCGIVSCDKETTSGTVGPANTTLAIDPRLSPSGFSGITNPIIDVNTFTLHGFTSMILPQSQASGNTGLPTGEQPQDFRLEVPVNRDFFYKSATGVVGGTQYGKVRNYYVVWAVSDGYGGSTPSLASCQLSYLVEFKDA